MAGSGWQDFKDMASWYYNRATSRPLKRVEETLDSGKPAPDKEWEPSRPNPQRAAKRKSKRPSKKRSRRRK